ncbi:hypothetical protein D9611_007643 [Ephemerocybe angulata]|uniref:FAD-binding FR-type domain-containing protein n=1 Tax=Ephemerocybe angulata TaxID=980116 RepID=A0A8H5BY18_9AGAR|nr:hypothetical protein D9611_007643 [Tulosesus angulatus]
MLSPSLRRGLARRALSTSAGKPSRTSKRVVSAVAAFTAAGVAAYVLLPDPTRSAPTLKNAPLSPRYFTPVTVVSNEESGPDTKVLTLAVPPEVLAASDPNGFHTIWSVFIKDDDIQVERPYTPLYGIDDKGHMVFWIKKYPRGEVGRWLHTKAPGEKIEFRGPLATWDWKNDTWDEVVLISGGTGFAPFHQLLSTVISNPTMSPSTRFTLLHSSKRPEELPPPSLLQPLIDYAEQHPERVNVDLFVDTSDGSAASNLHVKRIDRSAIESALGLIKPTPSWWGWLWKQREPQASPKRRVFLVCGPEAMINAIAGPYGRNLSQGQVGGALGEMGLKPSEVYKL